MFQTETLKVITYKYIELKLSAQYLVLINTSFLKFLFEVIQ
jgi:hypothetical protein